MPESVPLRILLADDSRDILLSLSMLLEMEGHEVQSALDGQQALAVAETFCPHVMVLDLGMPGLDGYSTAQAVRAQPWGQSISLIAFTGRDNDIDRARAHAAGFDHHVVKPVDPDVLIDLIASLHPPQPNGQAR